MSPTDVTLSQCVTSPGCLALALWQCGNFPGVTRDLGVSESSHDLCDAVAHLYKGASRLRRVYSVMGCCFVLDFLNFTRVVSAIRRSHEVVTECSCVSKCRQNAPRRQTNTWCVPSLFITRRETSGTSSYRPIRSRSKFYEQSIMLGLGPRRSTEGCCHEGIFLSLYCSTRTEDKPRHLRRRKSCRNYFRC